MAKGFQMVGQHTLCHVPMHLADGTAESRLLKVRLALCKASEAEDTAEILGAGEIDRVEHQRVYAQIVVEEVTERQRCVQKSFLCVVGSLTLLQEPTEPITELERLPPGLLDTALLEQVT